MNNQTNSHRGVANATEGPRVLLVVSGSIAAYKSCQLARRLVSGGAQVRVLMTESASSFVQPLSFEYITGMPVAPNRFEGEEGANVDHIGLARWPDMIVIAPISANRLARLALGLADDLLGACVLATTAPLLIAPAMNHQMWKQGIVRQHLDTLRARGWRVAEPGSGEQACGETGPGRMMEVEELMPIIDSMLDGNRLAQAPAEGGAGSPAGRPSRQPGLRCLLTMGATIEDIDPVRFLSNRSSGRMGLALFESLVSFGVETRALCASISAEVAWRRSALGLDESFAQVRGAEQMLEAALGQIDEFKPDIVVAVAAVCDYRPVAASAEKIASGQSPYTLELTANPDIIARIKQDHPEIFCVAFAAQTHDLRAKARAKLAAKGVDMLVANPVGGAETDTLDSQTIRGLVLSGEDEREFGPMAKSDFAAVLAEDILSRLRLQSSASGADAGNKGRQAGKSIPAAGEK